MDALALLVLSLGTFRLAHLLSHEPGPGHVLDRLHRATGAIYDAREERWRGSGFFAEVLSCPLCLSLWIAPVLFGIWLLGPVGQGLLTILAIAGASSAIHLAVSAR